MQKLVHVRAHACTARKTARRRTVREHHGGVWQRGQTGGGAECDSNSVEKHVSCCGFCTGWAGHNVQLPFRDRRGPSMGAINEKNISVDRYMGLVRFSDVSEKTEEKKTTSSQKSVDLTL